MENIINKIIQIEDQAQEIMLDASNLKGTLNENIEKQVSEIRADIEKRVKTKYETIQRTEESYADKKIEDIKVQYIQAEEILKQTYETHKEEWVNEIYKSVLGI